MAKGLSQQKLGLLLGMDHNTASARMNQYERGKHQPDYLSLSRIAVVLEVPVAYFFCEDSTMATLVCRYYKLAEKTKMKIKSLLEIVDENEISGQG